MTIRAVTDDSPHACRDQPADPDIAYPGAYQHPRAVSAARHGMSYSAGEETEEGRGGKEKRGEVLWRCGDVEMFKRRSRSQIIAGIGWV